MWQKAESHPRSSKPAGNTSSQPASRVLCPVSSLWLRTRTPTLLRARAFAGVDDASRKHPSRICGNTAHGAELEDGRFHLVQNAQSHGPPYAGSQKHDHTAPALV
jgi:hypothetical protein